MPTTTIDFDKETAHRNPRGIPMKTAKQAALEVLANLPEDSDMEEIMYRLYVLENLRKGRQDAIDGNTLPAEQLLEDIQTW